ncbi:hypothetical protein F2P79_012397 [Pimephales promelas]|nr:hypothetical protein F2P79_012397 [Pimephales promelas]
MEEILKRLTEVSIRQQQIVEHLATRQGRTEEELIAIGTSATQHIPLPDSRAQATRLLPKMTVDDDVEAFLQVFETTAKNEAWPEEEMARALAPLLTGEAQRAYFSLPRTDAEDYNKVKQEILARLGLSSICAAQQFQEWEFKPRVPARAQAAELSRIAQHWLLEGNPTAAQVVERVVVDRLLRALPRAHRQAVGMRNPTNILELVEAMELADAIHHREAGDRALPFPRRVVQDQPADRWFPHREMNPCPALNHRHPREHGKSFRALLDSGSAVTLIQSRLCGPRSGQKNFLPITCVHGDTRQVPSRRITISSPQGTWPVEAGLVKDLPVALLLGRDWPGFDRLLTAATQTASPEGNRQRRRRPRGPRRRPALLASDSGRDGESPSQITNQFYDVYQQAAGGGSFAKEQREDDRLKHCWAQRRGEEKKLLVVPRAKTGTILELAHSHPMAGHLGAPNTTQRIRDRFLWPGLEAKVKRFCQACPTCQVTSSRTPPPSPLIPLLIIEVPFERIGMDIVGPLPKSARGHEHILVIVDYATRYPEAVPLRKATAKSIAQELFLLASRVGLPSEILTDQGTPFMSRLMADLCRLLRVKQLRTTVYHPQTDGLVERFNQTLKQMLRRVTAEDKRDWDLMIPYVLFGIREVPQASTGFTPFELLFGRQPRGLLDVAREAWEQQPAPHRTIIEHVRQMRERIDRVMPLVHEHLCKAQQAQQRHYDRASPTTRIPARRPRHGPGPQLCLQVPGLLERAIYGTGKNWTRHVQAEATWSAAGGPTLPCQPPKEFQDVFSTQPGRTSVIQHDIKTSPGVIVRQRPYRIPEARRQAIEDEIQQMLKLGVIEPSRSPWSSPIVMVQSRMLFVMISAA